MQLLEEREWRIVFHESIKNRLSQPSQGGGKPNYYIPLRIGHDLASVVFPDNRTIAIAREKKILDKLTQVDRYAPHVHITSLEDIGCF